MCKGFDGPAVMAQQYLEQNHAHLHAPIIMAAA